MVEKQRLDILIADRGLAESREMARRLIMEGNVTVAGQVIDKPGTRVALSALLAVKALPRFVSRGGDKLDAALIAFDVQVTDQVCVDVGASTGGFTDCLLKHGAAKVYAIDVGYGQLDYRLRRDPHVVVMERTNARYVEQLPEQPTLAVVDASFISLKLLLPVIKTWLTANAHIVALIKPQFEAGRSEVGKGGVVKDGAIHASVLRDILSAALSGGFNILGLILSPLKGPAGNIEFLVYLGLAARSESELVPDLDALIHAVLP